MQIEPLAVPDAFMITPRQFPDDRGVFLEWFKPDLLELETGHSLTVEQANCSVSSRGVLRGIHYADVPPGQAKYVTCFSGSVLDVVVDIRVGSPTFGAVDSVVLDAESRRAVYVAQGLGHGFMALSETATVSYLCSTPYAPDREHGLDPLDPGLGIDWPQDVPPVLSPKDAEAPTLAQALDAGVLPRYDDCTRWYAR